MNITATPNRSARLREGNSHAISHDIYGQEGPGPNPRKGAFPMRFAVSIVTPPNYPHSEAFREVAEAIHHGLLALGHDSVLTSRTDFPDRRHIVLGANLLAHYPVPLAPETILYNLEQVFPGSPWFPPQLLDLFRRHPVWDYSVRNLRQLARLGVTRLWHLPVGYAPPLTRIPRGEEDIDVLFFGSLNERRERVLAALRQAGVKVHAVFGLYGPERDRLIASSKIVLNVHYYEARVFEVVRVSYLLANRRFVVSERGCDLAEEAPFSSAVAFATYDRLADVCVAYLADPGARERFAEFGFQAMLARSQAAYLDAALRAPPRCP